MRYRKTSLLVLALAVSCGGTDPGTPIVDPPVGEKPLVIPAFPELPPQEASTLTDMLKLLPTQISSSATANASAIDRNPGLAAYLQAKVAMLTQPGLGQAIIDAKRFSTTSLASMGGRALPLVVVFPADSMRAEALATLPSLARVSPRLEDWYGFAYPGASIRMWYGFVIGNSGGAAIINMEDEGTYLARTTSQRMPFDAILFHELAHAYMSHESLNQFVELYLYNKDRGSPDDATTWQHARGWVPQAPGNTGVQALLDVYQLIGRDRMMTAYRVVQPMHPQYGGAPSAAAQQVFVDAAPAELKAQVATLMARVGF